MLYFFFARGAVGFDPLAVCVLNGYFVLGDAAVTAADRLRYRQAAQVAGIGVGDRYGSGLILIHGCGRSSCFSYLIRGFQSVAGYFCLVITVDFGDSVIAGRQIVDRQSSACGHRVLYFFFARGAVGFDPLAVCVLNGYFVLGDAAVTAADRLRYRQRAQVAGILIRDVKGNFGALGQGLRSSVVVGHGQGVAVDLGGGLIFGHGVGADGNVKLVVAVLDLAVSDRHIVEGLIRRSRRAADGEADAVSQRLIFRIIRQALRDLQLGHVGFVGVGYGDLSAGAGYYFHRAALRAFALSCRVIGGGQSIAGHFSAALYYGVVADGNVCESVFVVSEIVISNRAKGRIVGAGDGEGRTSRHGRAAGFLLDRQISGGKGVDDLAVGVDSRRCANVALRHRSLGDGVVDHFAVAVLGHARPGIGPGVAAFLALIYFGRGSLDSVGETVQSQSEGSGTHAQLVIVVGPGLGDGDVGQFVCVGKGRLISGVGLRDGAGDRFVARGAGGFGCRRTRGVAFTAIRSVLALARYINESKGGREAAFGDGVSGTGRQVVCTDVVAFLDVDRESGAAGRIVIAAAIVYDSLAGYYALLGNRIVSFKDGDPHPVIGIVVWVIRRF